MSQPSPVTNSARIETAVAAVPRSASDRASVREVSRAVTSLNEADYAGQGREVTFSFDRATRQPVIKVVDVNTKEIVSQWPAEYVLHLADGLKENARDSG
jgi:uncharacterized FlaG/YvyC family protein